MTGGLVVAVTYYLSASLAFPKSEEEWPSLDEHYWAQKRLVLGGVGIANIVILGFTLIHFTPELEDWLFFVWQAAYWIPLMGLLFSRHRKVDIVLLTILIAQYLAFASNLFRSRIGVSARASRVRTQ